MSESSRNKPAQGGSRGSSSRGVPSQDFSGPRASTSITRTAIAVLIGALGIAWIAVYINIAQDGGSLTWMGDLERWNFLIGFGLVFLALAVAAHKSTPLGRGRGVVAGMLGCFLLGLIWIVVYYIAGTQPIPVMRNLGQYNLLVGIGFMAMGFSFATKWE